MFTRLAYVIAIVMAAFPTHRSEGISGCHYYFGLPFPWLTVHHVMSAEQGGSGMVWTYSAGWAMLLCVLSIWAAAAGSLVCIRFRRRSAAEATLFGPAAKKRPWVCALVAVVVFWISGSYVGWRHVEREREYARIAGPGISAREWVGRRMAGLVSGSDRVTNYIQLITVYNHRFRSDYPLAPLATNGNPLPRHFPRGTYFWLRWWEFGCESRSHPLLWYVPSNGGNRIEYLTFGGEWKQLAIQDFTEFIQPFSNRVVRAGE